MPAGYVLPSAVNGARARWISMSANCSVSSSLYALAGSRCVRREDDRERLVAAVSGSRRPIASY